MGSWAAAAIFLFVLFVFFAILTVIGIVMIVRSRRRVAAAPVIAPVDAVSSQPAGQTSRSSAAAPDATVAVSTASFQPRRLHCIGGPNAGQVIDLTGEGVYIGRDAALSHVVIGDSRVSKRHLWVGARNGEVVAIDQGSTNGTYVNDPASPRIEERTLSSGDVLIVSNDVARFRLE